MLQYLNVLFSSSGNNLTGLSVPSQNILESCFARTSQDADLTRFDLNKVRFGVVLSFVHHTPLHPADLCPGGGGGALPAARRGELGHAGLCSPLPLCAGLDNTPGYEKYLV